MNYRKQKNLIVVINPLGLVLANIDNTEITFFTSVTHEELRHVMWAAEAYEALIECCCEE